MNGLLNNDDNQEKYTPSRDKREHKTERIFKIISFIIVSVTVIVLFWQGNAIIEFNLDDNPSSTPGYEPTAPGSNTISGEKEDIHFIVSKYNKLFQNNVVTNWQSYEIDENIPYSITNSPFERGISISQYNSFDQSIDWKSVKADGIDYAIIRIGGRGYETGNIYVDTNFFDHIEGAQKNGIKIGCYFYSQAITREEVDEEI